MQATQMHSISVIIRAYTAKHWAHLLAAVHSVQRQRTPANEIIVVVDHNRPLWRRLRQALPKVRVIENQQQPGATGARNSGIVAATGEIIAFMDDDGVAEPDWLTYLAASYDDEKVMGVGGAIIPTWESGRPAWFPPEFDWVVGCTAPGQDNAVKVVHNLNSSNMSFRRRVFAAIGGFHQGMMNVGAHPIGNAETAFCIRAQQQWPNHVLLYEPMARVHHYVPPHQTTWRYFQTCCYIEGLAKAQISKKAGAQKAMAAIRRQPNHTLRRGLRDSLRDCCLRGDKSGLHRAAAMAVGVALTVIGYSIASIHHQLLQHEVTTPPWLLGKTSQPIPAPSPASSSTPSTLYVNK